MNEAYFKNRFYRFRLDFLNRAQILPATLDKCSVEMLANYKFSTNILKNDWLNPMQSVFTNTIIGGLPDGLLLVKSMPLKDALIKQLNSSLQTRHFKIPEADIQPFLNNAGSQYNGPLANKPMQWDATTKVIYCIESSSKASRAAIRL